MVNNSINKFFDFKPFRRQQKIKFVPKKQLLLNNYVDSVECNIIFNRLWITSKYRLLALSLSPIKSLNYSLCICSIIINQK